VASARSRGLRFYTEAGLVYFFGAPIQRFIDRHFNRLAWAFGLLIIAGFALLKLMH
jgi:hypothetical protein